MKLSKPCLRTFCLLILLLSLIALVSCNQPSTETLQPFAEAEIVGVEWYKGPSKHSPVEGEDLEALKALLKELVIETAMPPSELYAGTTRYYLTLAEGKIVWISTPGHEDKIWIDNVFYTCKTPALIEKLGEIAQAKFEESYVEP